jgi:hypothetical protein
MLTHQSCIITAAAGITAAAAIVKLQMRLWVLCVASSAWCPGTIQQTAAAHVKMRLAAHLKSTAAAAAAAVLTAQMWICHLFTVMSSALHMWISLLLLLLLLQMWIWYLFTAMSSGRTGIKAISNSRTQMEAATRSPSLTYKCTPTATMF